MASTIFRNDWAGLLDGHRNGNRDATAELAHRALPIVTKTVRGRIAPSLVDDAVQETMFKVIRKAATVRDPDAFPGWLKMVAKRTAIDTGIRSRRQIPVEVSAFDTLADQTVIDIDAMASRLDAVGVAQDLDCLSDRERRIVEFFTYNHGVSYIDAAEQLGCPIGSIGPTRQRAMEKLRRSKRTLARC